MVYHQTKYPYSPRHNYPKQCKNSGTGYIHCTPTIREKYQKICVNCPSNPEPKTEPIDNGPQQTLTEEAQ